MGTEDWYFITSIVLYSTGHWIGGTIALIIGALALIGDNYK